MDYAKKMQICIIRECDLKEIPLLKGLITISRKRGKE
jgi:hypothetical protein